MCHFSLVLPCMSRYTHFTKLKHLIFLNMSRYTYFTKLKYFTFLNGGSTFFWSDCPHLFLLTENLAVFGVYERTLDHITCCTAAGLVLRMKSLLGCANIVCRKQFSNTRGGLPRIKPTVSRAEQADFERTGS
jgi:hypothetical protein